MSNPPDRAPKRVRHTLKQRKLTVVSVQDLTPVLRRIVLAGEDLDGFYSPGFDDHIKIFPVFEGQDYPQIVMDEGGLKFAEPYPVMRDYTPRAYDAEAGLLTIDFVVGHDGPATRWAQEAAIGSKLALGGPRGSILVTPEFAHHLLIGDETALPAIERRLEELGPDVQAVVVMEVENEAGQIELSSRASLSVYWAHRAGAKPGDGTALTQAAVKAAQAIDPVDTYVWVATESSVARAMRPKLLAANSFNPKHMKVAGYWRRGAEGSHDVFADEE